MSTNGKIIKFPISKEEYEARLYDDFELDEVDFNYFEQKDYQNLVNHREQVAERNPGDVSAHIRLGKAYILACDFGKALEFLPHLHHEFPDMTDISHLILDALFALGKNENDFQWIKKPLILRLGNRVLDMCYEYLKPKRKPATINDLYLIFIIKGFYVCFSESELFEALSNDPRFEIKKSYTILFAEVKVLRNAQRSSVRHS